jgi:hypothetical protein
MLPFRAYLSSVLPLPTFLAFRPSALPSTSLLPSILRSFLPSCLPPSLLSFLPSFLPSFLFGFFAKIAWPAFVSGCLGVREENSLFVLFTYNKITMFEYRLSLPSSVTSPSFLLSFLLFFNTSLERGRRIAGRQKKH